MLWFDTDGTCAEKTAEKARFEEAHGRKAAISADNTGIHDDVTEGEQSNLISSTLQWLDNAEDTVMAIMTDDATKTAKKIRRASLDATETAKKIRRASLG